MTNSNTTYKARLAGQTAPGPGRRFPVSWPNLGAEALAVAGAYARGSEDFFIINDPQIASRPASRRMAKKEGGARKEWLRGLKKSIPDAGFN